MLQCFLLRRLVISQPIDLLSLDLNSQGSFNGTEQLDCLYPVVHNQYDLPLLWSLAYDYGYGPNAFPWNEKRVQKGFLAGKPTTLYLVSIDVGKLTGKASCNIWKIGITQKQFIVGKGDNARFPSRYNEIIKVLRAKRYDDGELAYIREQVYLEQVQYERTRSLASKYDHAALLERDLANLGVSEWVLEGRSKSLAIEYFDRLTIADSNY